jgi:CheY-like chemotaxis protein
MAGILLDSPLRPEQAQMVALIQSSAEALLALLGDKPATGVPPAAEPPRQVESAAALHLLLAEDDPANQMVDLTLLTRLGHIVEAVSDGSQVLDRLADGDYDAVILDCQMPTMDGFEVTQKIRAGAIPGLNPKIPIIALTAYTGKAERDRCLSSGMNDCLSKPLNPAQMTTALQRCGLNPSVGQPAALAAPAAAAPLPAGEEPVLELGLLRTMRSAPGHHGQTLLDDFVALFLRDEPRRVSELRTLAAKRVPAELARLAHTVGGSCAMMGAKQMQSAALALERAANSLEWTEVDAALGRIDTAWDSLRQALRAEGYPCP